MVAAIGVVNAISSDKREDKDEVAVEDKMEDKIEVNTDTSLVLSKHSDAQVEELNAEIEDLKTKLAAYEANTFKQEEKVAEKLVDDSELLEKFYATQMELEQLTDQTDTINNLQSDLNQLKLKLDTTEETKLILDKKLNTVLEDMKTNDSEELKIRIANLESENVKLLNSTNDLTLIRAELESQINLQQEKVDELLKRIESQKKLRGQAQRNPRRAATAVAAVAVRGVRHNANTQELKDLQNKIRLLEKTNRELERKMGKTEIRMEREKTVVGKKANKAEADVDKLKNRLADTKKKLAKQQEECKEHSDRLKTLERSSKTADGEIVQLRKSMEEYTELQVVHAALQKSLKASQLELVEITDKYTKEMLLRKKYYNIIEDMKGKVRVYCRSRPLSKDERNRGNFSVVNAPDEFTIKVSIILYAQINCY